MSDDLKSKTVRGLKWTTMDSVAQNVFQIVTGIVLANLVAPEEFGIIAVLNIFIALANLFQDSGFGVALTRKKEVSKQEYSSVFYFTIILSALIYFSLFFSLDLISEWQKATIPTGLARFMFLTFFISSFGTVPYVVLSRNVDYKSIAYSNAIALVVSSSTAVVLGYLGFGAWAVCTQTVLYHLLRVAGLWIRSSWKPIFYFSFRPLKEMFTFSSKLMATYIVYTIANNITPNLIGRYFNFREAGYYYQASKWYNKPVLFVTGPIGAVSLPVISKVNDDEDRQKRVFRKMVKTMTFVAFPLSIFFTYIIPEFVRIFLPGWLDVIPYMQLLCLGAIFVPMDTLFFNLFNSRGKSGALFLFTLTKSILTIVGLFISIKSSIFALIIAIGIVNYIFFGLISIYSMKLIRYKVGEWIKDVFPYLIVPVAIVTMLYYILPGIDNNCLSLVLKGGICVGLYLLVMYFCKSEILEEGTAYLERFIRRHKKKNK